MKHLAFAFALILLAGPLWSGKALMPTTYSDSLTGSIAPAGSSTLSLEGNASGALPGRFGVSINSQGNDISGGSWWLVITRSNPDGSTSEIGGLTGDISGGTVTLNADSSVASLTSTQVIVQKGSGEFAGVTGGSGSIQGSLDRENSPQFSGTLSLTF